jgi:hypothetical protein
MIFWPAVRERWPATNGKRRRLDPPQLVASSWASTALTDLIVRGGRTEMRQ